MIDKKNNTKIRNIEKWGNIFKVQTKSKILYREGEKKNRKIRREKEKYRQTETEMNDTSKRATSIHFTWTTL